MERREPFDTPIQKSKTKKYPGKDEPKSSAS